MLQRVQLNYTHSKARCYMAFDGDVYPLQYFNDPVTHAVAGPFTINSLAWQAYVDKWGYVSAINPPTYFPFEPEYLGDPLNVDPTKGNWRTPQPQPQPQPQPIPQPQPKTDPVKPDSAGQGKCFVYESFVSAKDGSGPGFQDYSWTALIGSDRWRKFESDHVNYRPATRAVYDYNIPWTSTDTNATVFNLDGVKPVGVPASSFPTGYYNCDHIGFYSGWNDSLTQAAYDKAYCVKKVDEPPPLVPPPPPGQNCGFYDCPSNTSNQPCCHDYTGVFTAIQKAIEDIALKISSTTKDCCDLSDSCINQIYDKIWAKLSKVKKTCSQCCDDVKNGIAQSSQDALACAAMECDCAEKECQPVGSQSADGSTCSNCNQKPCCCKNGACEPCEPNRIGVWHAYCNPDSGMVLATQDDALPDIGYQLVGEFDSQRDAYEAAQRVCSPQTPPYTPPNFTPEIPPPLIDLSPVCNISSYGPNGDVNKVLSGVSGAKIADYVLNAVQGTLNAVADGSKGLPVIQQLTRMLAATASNPYFTAKVMSPYIQQLMGCDEGNAQKAISALVARGLISQHVGIDLNEFTPHLSYSLHTLCRNKLLSPSDAMSAFLANAVTRDELDTYFAIAGFCGYEDGRMVEAARAKFTAAESATLLRRKEITQQEYANRIRALGFIRDNDAEEIFKLTEVRPGVSDIIRFMVRDTDDEKTVQQFDLDSQFTQKYQTQLKQWAQDQGVPDKVMQYAWRAHWDIPSPTALYQFKRRLRHNDTFNANGELDDAIRSALVQQDILPYWIDKFLAIAYQPLSRIDVRRAFNIGSITEEQVTASYWDQGYSDENAEILTKFAVKLRDKSAIGHWALKQWQQYKLSKGDAHNEMTDDGLPAAVVDKAFKQASGSFITSWPIKAFINGDMPSNEVRTELTDWGVDADAIETILASTAALVRNNNYVLRYAAGTVDRQSAIAGLSDYGMSDDRSNRLLDKVDVKIEAVQITNCVNSIKRRFLLGEYSADDAYDALVKNGIVKDRAQLLMNGWGCEKSANGKAVPTAELCLWLSNGVITPLEFVQRLQRIGYTAKDAANILADCQGKINAKQAAQAMKQAKADAAAIAKQERRAKIAEAQLEREAKQIAAAGKKAKAARDRRTKQIAGIVEKLYKKAYGDIYTIGQTVNGQYNALRDNYALNQDQAISAMMLAAEAYKQSDNISWEQITDGMAQAEVNKALEPDELQP